MSARLATPLVVLSLLLPTVASSQDSLPVEQRLGRIETQLAEVIAALDLDRTQWRRQFRATFLKSSKDLSICGGQVWSWPQSNSCHAKA